MWFYIYDIATGRLLSETDTAPQLAGGRAAVERASRAESTVMWDETTTSFVDRPAKVLIDRLQDLTDDPALAAVWTRLTVAQRTVLRNRLVALLGSQRMRGSEAPVNLP
jgi:hypothetical protein